MKEVIFREYDIRGKVGSEFDIDRVEDLTRAILYYFQTKNDAVRTVVVGMDGRTHSPFIKQLVCKALVNCGIKVIFIGVCPSPVLYFALHTQQVDAGLMITASHNPKEYNGIKICLGTHMVWGEQIAEIKRLFNEKIYAPYVSTVGVVTDFDCNSAYIVWLTDHFKHLKNRSVPIVIDCANGASGVIIPSLIKTLGWSDVHILYPEVDGSYPHHEADPTVEKNMLDVRAAITQYDAWCGIGLDGDADRMAVMTKEGYLVPGDRLLAVFAQHMLQKHEQFTVVADIKSSENLIKFLKKWHLVPVLSPSGHAIIKKEMKKHNSLLAGELSCHFFFADRYFGYDDGIYALLRVVEMLIDTSKSITELLSVFPKTYGTREFRITYDDRYKHDIINAVKNKFKDDKNAQLITIDGVRVVTSYGWTIVRPSNTQMKLCMRFESDTADGLARLKSLFIGILSPYFDEHVLQSEFSS